MFTANTMSSAVEAMGMSLPGSAANPVVVPTTGGSDRLNPDKVADCEASVAALFAMMRAGIRSRDILTRHAIENAIVVVYAMGGSTNAFLHLLAIAHEAEVPLAIQEIGEIGKKVPILANMRPHGHFHMSDLGAIGGVPVVMKELLAAGFLHGGVLTCTGRTLAENLATYPSLSQITQSVVTPVVEPFSQPVRRPAPRPHCRPPPRRLLPAAATGSACCSCDSLCACCSLPAWPLPPRPWS